MVTHYEYSPLNIVITFTAKITGESVSGDAKALAEFPVILKTMIGRGNYPPELVFNIDETGLFWKRIPERTRRRGGNANGDFKSKPLLVYHSKKS